MLDCGPDALQKEFARYHREVLGTYPGFINLLFQIGRTSLEKYSASPSLLPLNRAVPEPSPTHINYMRMSH